MRLRRDLGREGERCFFGTRFPRGGFNKNCKNRGTWNKSVSPRGSDCKEMGYGPKRSKKLY